MNIINKKAFLFAAAFFLISSSNSVYGMKKRAFCLNIGSGICIADKAHLNYKFDGNFEGNDLYIASTQNGNIIHLFILDNSPCFVLNGHVYHSSIRGSYYLAGQKLYNLDSCSLVTPVKSNFEEWKPKP